MTLFPVQNHVLETTLSPAEVHMVIAGKTTARKPIIPPARQTHFFWGELQPQGFHIHHILGYRNSFSPLITGKLTAANPGTTLNISMELRPSVRTFNVIWCYTVATIYLFSLLVAHINQSIHPIGIILPPGMLIFMYLLTHLLFKLGSKAALAEIKHLLKDAEKQV